MIGSEQYVLTSEEINMMMGQPKQKDYSPFMIKKGQLVKKKIKYSNLDVNPIVVNFQCDKDDIVSVKQNQCTIEPGSLLIFNNISKGSDFIRLRILVPADFQEEEIQFSVTVFNIQEECILEKLNFCIRIE